MLKVALYRQPFHKQEEYGRSRNSRSALVLNLMAGSFQTFQQGFAVPQLKVIISCPD